MTSTLEDLSTPKAKFKKSEQRSFAHVVKKRVDSYFSTHKISRYGDYRLYLKTLLFAALYLICFAAIFSNQFQGIGLILIYTLLGLVKSCIGMNVIHDALHGSYSKKQWLNALIGYWFDFNGTSSLIWKISHNIHHHTFTNIPGHDDDINKAILLRLSPTDKVYWFHRFQPFYAPLLYGFTTLNWVFYSDFAWFWRESKARNLSRRDIAIFLFFKMMNLGVFIVLPMIFLTAPWWVILVGFICLHLAASVLIALFFQLAHIIENVEYPETDEKGYLDNEWAVHEMITSANFALKDPVVTFICGGLNFQVEHHLFPYISHVHYPAISPIVKETAREFGIPYNEYPTFFSAVQSHFRTLKRFGVGEI